MKKLLTILALVAVSATHAAPTTTTTAATPVSGGGSSVFQVLGKPVFPMISSPSALRAYALSKVTAGNASVYSNWIKAYGGGSTQVTVSGGTPNTILAALSQYQFTFSLLDPSKDTVGISSDLAMQMGNWNYALFYGYGSGQVVKDAQGNLTVPTPNITMRLNSQIPIKVGSDVSQVSLYYRDGYGNTRYDNVNVYDGWMYFHTDYAGKAGQLVLWNTNGTSSAVDIESGAEVVMQKVTMNGKMGLLNYLETSDASLVVGSSAVLYVPFAVTGSRDMSDAPVIRVNLKDKNRAIGVIDAVARYAGKTEAPIVTAYGPSGQAVSGVLFNDGTINIQANEAGDWSITFEYPTLFGEDVEPYFYNGGYDSTTGQPNGKG